MVGHGSRGRGFGRGGGDIGLPREVYQRGAKDEKGQNVYSSKTFNQGDQSQEENQVTQKVRNNWKASYEREQEKARYFEALLKSHGIAPLDDMPGGSQSAPNSRQNSPTNSRRSQHTGQQSQSQYSQSQYSGSSGSLDHLPHWKPTLEYLIIV